VKREWCNVMPEKNTVVMWTAYHHHKNKHPTGS